MSHSHYGLLMGHGQANKVKCSEFVVCTGLNFGENELVYQFFSLHGLMMMMNDDNDDDKN